MCTSLIIVPAVNHKAIRENAERQEQEYKEWQEQHVPTPDPPMRDQIIGSIVMFSYPIFALVLVLLYLKMRDKKTLKSKIFYWGFTGLWAAMLIIIFLIKYFGE